jgi:hypothetical protein
VVLKAVGADGTTAFEGRVSPAGAAAGDRLDAAARAVFDVPPGQLRMRMSIEDAGAREVDFDAREIMIRSLGAPVALSTPEVFRARNALEFRVLQGDPDAVPVAGREFSRTERLIIRVAAYGPPDAVPTVTAKLLNRTGQSMREVPVVPSSVPGRPNQIDLPLAGLAAGEYVLEVKAVSSAGESIDRIGFRVVG